MFLSLFCLLFSTTLSLFPLFLSPFFIYIILTTPNSSPSYPTLTTILTKTTTNPSPPQKATVDANQDAEVILSRRAGDVKFTGKTYALNYAIPNFYFHFVTAYAVLRKEGVPVGKSDYLGEL